MSSSNLAPAPFETSAEAGIAPVVAAAQKVWKRMQKDVPALPDATIIVKRDNRAWGHTTTAKVWGAQKVTKSGRGKKAVTTVSLEDMRYEVMLSGELLAKGATEVLATLLHEATHALNLAAGIRDTDVNGRHSKGAFGETATATWGLTVKDTGTYIGWSETLLEGEALKRWSVEVRMIDAALKKASVAHHGKAVGGVAPVPGIGVGGTGRGTTATGGRVKSLDRATCDCTPDARGWVPNIRASAQTLEVGIRCDVCKGLFSAKG